LANLILQLFSVRDLFSFIGTSCRMRHRTAKYHFSQLSPAWIRVYLGRFQLHQSRKNSGKTVTDNFGALWRNSLMTSWASQDYARTVATNQFFLWSLSGVSRAGVAKRR
jgi:hypothetical protein